MGNNRIVADIGGNPIQRNSYYPFGMSYGEDDESKQGKQDFKYNGKELDRIHGLNHYDYSARQYDPARLQFTTVDPHAENYYSWSPYAYVANNPMRYIDPTGCDTVPSNEVWEYNLINYRSDGHSGLHEEAYYPVIQNGKMTYRLHKITSGENEGNYAAIAIYGQDEDGNEIYEYQFIVGADKIEDFRGGETEASGYLRGFVKLAADSGNDGRKSSVEKCYKWMVGNRIRSDIMGWRKCA